MLGVLADGGQQLLWIVAGAIVGGAAVFVFLKVRVAFLAAALDNLPLGVVLFDSKRRVVLCNRRYREIYSVPAALARAGTPVQALIQHRLSLGLKISSTADDYIRERASAVVSRSASVHEFDDGRIIAYAMNPMPDGGGMATHEDITEREALSVELKHQHDQLKRQEEALRVRNLQFDTAINNIPQGLCFFSGDHRLVVCNDQFLSMYDLPPGSIGPGSTVKEIIDLRAEAGSMPAMTKDEFREWRANVAVSAEPVDSLFELSNGKTFEVRHRPMSDGGWVATHEDITEQRRAEFRIAHMAHHDALTDLANRALLNERLQATLGVASAERPMAILQLDLDRFKPVNDTLGHPVGDKLLRMVAERLRALVRDRDTVARMGGDEFAIILAEATAANAESLARQVVASLSEPYEIDGHRAIIGASVGIAVGPADGARPEDLLRNADLALYRAKSDGRGNVKVFESEMNRELLARRALEQDLQRALANDEFELYYQPIVDLADDRIAVVEALVRWNHPTKGLLGPGAFIPLAEETGFIVPLGEWIIREACRTAATWPDDVTVAVNVSAAQFRRPGLPLTVVAALAASGLAAPRLEVEITESVLLQDKDAAFAMLQALRDLGVHIAMDDFGTGYSTFSYLQTFRFDKIKIDRSFVTDIASNTGSLSILRAAAALADGLGMRATAEGVETADQLELVIAAGCTEVQGYLFSKPVPARDIAEMIRRGQGLCGIQQGVAVA